MAQTMKVDSSQLRTAAQKFDSERTMVCNLMNSMKNTASGTRNFWQGQASNNYRNQFSKLDDEMRFIINKIQEHANDLRDIARIYDDVEDKNAQASSRLTTDF